MASTGEFWLVDFGDAFPGEPADLRPALVLGPPGMFGGDLPFTFVTPLTTKRRGLSLHVEVEPDAVNGLSATSYVQCELLKSVSTRRLTRHVGHANALIIDRVRSVVAVLLDL
jgi:mRNA interferase MazF